MSDNLPEYEVDKILKRRLRGNQTEYFLQWAPVENNGKIERTWEPSANLDCCDEFLNDFVQSKGSKFIGAKKVDDSNSYLMKWKDCWAESIVTSDEAKAKWPRLLLDFLETKLRITINEPADVDTNRRRSITLAVENENAIGNPVEVTYVTDIGDNINYWVKFEDDDYKFVEAGEMAQHWPNLAINFLEGKLLSAATPQAAIPQAGKMITRGMKKNLIEKGFGDDVEVAVTRKTDIDQILLFRRSKSVSRRRTLATIEPIRSILKQKNGQNDDARKVRKSADALMQRSQSTPNLSLTSQNADENSILDPIPSTSAANMSPDLPSPAVSTPVVATPRKCPQLIPLNALLKQPKKAPFNVRRKSMDGVSMGKIATTNVRQTMSAPSTPVLPKRTATKIIMDRLSDFDQSHSKRLTPRPLFNDPDFGKLRYSASSDSE